MESTKEWDGDDRSSCLYRAFDRGVFRKSKMGTGAIVTVGVGPEDPAKMRFAKDHDMIQALSLDRSSEPFDVSVLPR